MTAMDEYQDIKELLKPQRAIGASANLRQRISDATAQKRRTANKTRWHWSAAAAACLALVLGTTLLFNNKVSTTTSTDNSDCIVYVAGQKASGDEAQAIAEADVAKMEHFMRTVEQQNAAEEEKVNQFMQHKSLQK